MAAALVCMGDCIGMHAAPMLAHIYAAYIHRIYTAAVSMCPRTAVVPARARCMQLDSDPGAWTRDGVARAQLKKPPRTKSRRARKVP